VTAKRKWSIWPGRTAAELNSVSGVAGVGGAAVGIAGWSLLAGTPALVLTSFGSFVMVAAFGYAVYKGFPPVLRRPEELVGQIVTIKELDFISPKITTLAIIGPSKAGKTTLKDRLTFSVSGYVRTQDVTAHIVALQTTPPTFMAILDGGGEKYAQQFKIAESCDCLCAIIDHNASDTDASVDPQRLLEHEAFLKQIRHYLDENNSAPKRWVQFLVNKHDLWANASAGEQADLTKFCTDEVGRWRQGNRAARIEIANHSNSDASDISGFVDLLKRTTIT